MQFLEENWQHPWHYILYSFLYSLWKTLSKIKHGGFLQWWYPFNIPNQTILVLKPMAVGIPWYPPVKAQNMFVIDQHWLAATSWMPPPASHAEWGWNDTLAYMGDPINGGSHKWGIPKMFMMENPWKSYKMLKNWWSRGTPTIGNPHRII